MSTRSDRGDGINFPERVFHVEVLRGGMNRLLLRSNRSETWPTRLEVLFMNVKFMQLGTRFDGLTVEDTGGAIEHMGGETLAWRMDDPSGLRVYMVHSSSGQGFIVAGSVACKESQADASAPSDFPMMDGCL